MSTNAAAAMRPASVVEVPAQDALEPHDSMLDQPKLSSEAQLGLRVTPGGSIRRRASALASDGIWPWHRLRLLLDVMVLCAATALALTITPSPQGTSAQPWLTVGFPAVALMLLHARRTQDEALTTSLLDTFARVLGVVSLALMALLSLASLLGESFPLGLATRLFAFTTAGLALERMVLSDVKLRIRRAGGQAAPTLIVGAGTTGALIARRLLGDPTYGLRPVGFLDADPLPQRDPFVAPPVPLLGGPDDLENAIRQTNARRVILAFSSARDHLLVAKVRQCEDLGVDVSLVPRLYETFSERTSFDHIGGLPLLTLHAVNPRGWQFTLKHAIDRGAAAVLCVILAPFLVAIAVTVRLSSPGPVLFRQLRVGRDGREFHLLKFRTMRTDDEDTSAFIPPAGCAPGGVEGLDRRTGFGRWLRGLSLDELPQLFNVLRGEMSLVGPRPERPEFVARFVKDIERYDDRHRVKAGISGWAQVNGLRGQTSIAERVEWDNYYIRNWSLRLDLRILALTVAEVLRRRG